MEGGHTKVLARPHDVRDIVAGLAPLIEHTAHSLRFAGDAADHPD
jgi:hypothetical protein